MDNQYKTVSVRLSKADYSALQAIAKETCNSMSGVIRRLLNREKEGGKIHGESNAAIE